MRVGICEWTTFPACFEEELAAYRAAGAGDHVPTERLARRSVESMEALA